MAVSMDGKVALVTGAGSGIGRATALLFAKEGASVVVADRVVEGGEQTVRSIRDSGGNATFVPVDVTNTGQIEAMIAAAVSAYGRLDYAHNNAGVGSPQRGATAEYTEENWDFVLGVNLKGVWLCMKHEIPQMLSQGGGAIVNTASVAGLIGLRGSSAYVASKHGVVGLTKTAALEYAASGIRVNAVCPGYINTAMVEQNIANDPQRRDNIIAREPVGRLGMPEEIAAAVVWMCSDAASFVTGHTMTVDGGYVAQ